MLSVGGISLGYSYKNNDNVLILVIILRRLTQPSFNLKKIHLASCRKFIADILVDTRELCRYLKEEILRSFSDLTGSPKSPVRVTPEESCKGDSRYKKCQYPCPRRLIDPDIQEFRDCIH